MLSLKLKTNSDGNQSSSNSCPWVGAGPVHLGQIPERCFLKLSHLHSLSHPSILRVSDIDWSLPITRHWITEDPNAQRPDFCPQHDRLPVGSQIALFLCLDRSDTISSFLALTSAPQAHTDFADPANPGSPSSPLDERHALLRPPAWIWDRRVAMSFPPPWGVNLQIFLKT